jgi:hypothetical protein
LILKLFDTIENEYSWTIEMKVNNEENEWSLLSTKHIQICCAHWLEKKVRNKQRIEYVM